MRHGVSFVRIGVVAVIAVAAFGCGGTSAGGDSVGPGGDVGDLPVVEDVPASDPGTSPDVLPAHCVNGYQDEDETDRDCGGSCAGCTYQQKCAVAEDCATTWCVKGMCNVSTCGDGLLGPSETDIDCGNTCPPCAADKKCVAMSDCLSGVCVLGTCLAATCEDLHKNGNESDIDCGGDKCLPCANNFLCNGPLDCASGRCVSTHCMSCASVSDCPGDDQPCKVRTCTNGVCGHSIIAAGDPATHQAIGDCKKILCLADQTTQQENDDTDLPDDKNDCTVDQCDAGTPKHTILETGTACTTGGKVCDSTGACVGCLVDDDCPSLVCTGGKCGPASCGDGKKNGNETGKDCGGSCGKCPAGEGCKSAADCTTRSCDGTVCLAPACTDLVQNGDETAQDCGGLTCPGCDIGLACHKDGDCASAHCSASLCVQCILPTDCPGNDDECTSRTCDATNVCGTTVADFGKVPLTQAPGDCKTIICNGKGGTSLLIDDTDVPDDGKQCTANVCVDGVASNPPLQPGTPCTENGGTKCDAFGNCVP